MPIESVRNDLKNFGLEDRIRELESSSASVELAAQALQTDAARIAKTLSFFQADKPVLIVAAGDARVDNHKYKTRFGVKAKMIPYDQVEGAIGHAPGGVCPFAVKENVEVYLDKSLQRFETVFPACGSSNSAIELTLPELEKASRSLDWVDVCKDWQEQK